MDLISVSGKFSERLFHLSTCCQRVSIETQVLSEVDENCVPIYSFVFC